jgi:hypothetical protein
VPGGQRLEAVMKLHPRPDPPFAKSFNAMDAMERPWSRKEHVASMLYGFEQGHDRL